MLLEVDIIELGYEIFELSSFQHFLNQILPIVPSPRLVNFSKILNNKASLIYSFVVDADGALPFGMDSKPSFVFS